ncbi:DUF2190 family protein [Methylobacterium sp. WSM2598]|uniref:DUF2190 family protein n=1 Tax=Methylobacterium sp. WSM2598 TaxID=398261 RepID=UPI0003777611|nr:DUF2190 family protein [Methylobacterium sp. WSM2598]
MKNFLKSGHTMTVTLAAAAASGDLILQGTMFGVAATSGGIGDAIEIACGGIYTLAKAGSQAWTQGAALYWDATNKVATTSSASGANTKIGVAALAAQSADTTGLVRLNGSF